ncbi:MAPEG family protein [Acidisphaera sp. L21]|uniref:MAPEG family protein n=1 Tax=Acidisphaera sp. L21 TaxID=1641851 RepID=UPI00131B9DCC|nr:MAPEG family protein [Acidisphaera sp. L21]
MLDRLLSPTAGTAILWPLMAHVALVMALYVALTVMRQAAVKSGMASFATYEFGRDEPPAIARVTRNLANQFELPVLFYVAVILLMQLHAVLWLDVAFGWMFVAGRVIHSGVQTMTSDVSLRGKVFMINFVGTAGLLAHVLWVMVAG